jgi:hypothetical protein
MPYVAMHARTVPVEGSTLVPRTDPRGRATRGMVIMALVLGSLGANAMAASGYGSGDHTGAQQPAGHIRLGASSYVASSVLVSDRPWMY